MAIDLNGAPDLFDDAIGANEKRRANDAHLLVAIHVFFAPRAEFFGDLVIGIGEKREVQLVFSFELDVAGDIVGTNAKDFRAELFQLLRAVAESAGFARAAGRIVGGIEVQDDGAAFQIGELDF